MLRTATPGVEPPVLMGIELKGWYALAKESEPSFRYKVTPAVCAPQDLLVVVPWALSNVISGSPRVYTPFVYGARQAAENRNWYWQYARGRAGNREIIVSDEVDFYPTNSKKIVDRSAEDRGGNFGRFARTRTMDDCIRELFDEKLAGIPLWAWQRFLALFTENRTSDDILNGLESLEKGIANAAPSARARKRLRDKLRELGDIIADDA